MAGSVAPRAPSSVLQSLPVLVLLVIAGATETGAEAEFLDVGGCPLITGGSCPDPSVRFFLYTPLNPLEPQRIDYGARTSNITHSNFNASRPTKILVHGYNSDMGVFKGVVREYFRRGDYNVILLDWAELSGTPCYITAAQNTRFVGSCLSEMVLRAVSAGSSDLHLIGFSLGAHVPAFAANALRPYQVPRITGLDPAMPLFVTSDKDQKLDAGDAKFVDVVHTNAFMQGKSEQCGQVDFYMNGGITQPGCSGDTGCNHHRALLYFSESIRSTKGFWGWPCGGILTYVLGLCPARGTARRMGEDVDMKARGFYVARTNSEAPFAQGPWAPAAEERSRHTDVATPLLGGDSTTQPPTPTTGPLSNALWGIPRH